MARGLRRLRPIRRGLARLGSQSSAPRQIHLVWPGDPTRRLAVRWQTASARVQGWLELRAEGEMTWQRHGAWSRSAPGPCGLIHHCEIDGLEPDSAYEYRLGDAAGGESSRSAIQPVRSLSADRDAPLTVAFFADTAVPGRSDGRSDAMPRVFEALSADDPQLLLGGGDYVYADSDDRYHDPAAAIDAWLEQMEPLFARRLFLPSFGNHEIALGERFSDWAPRLTLPPGEAGGRSYSFDLGAAHFCALFAPGVAPDRRHLDWLERDLAAARERGVGWLIVYQHAALFAHGVCHPAREEVRSALMPIFERHQVDLHLSAHDQSYERTPPLRAGGREAATPLADVEAPRYRAGEGVLYAKVSPSGKRSNRSGDFSRLLAPAPDVIVARNDDCHHYALLRLDPQRIEVEVVGVPETPGPRRRVDGFSLERN